MAISGALAGLVGMNEIAGVQHKLLLEFVGGAGFTGIAVSLMGRDHPLGIVLAALLFGTLLPGGAELAVESAGLLRATWWSALPGLVVLFSRCDGRWAARRRVAGGHCCAGFYAVMKPSSMRCWSARARRRHCAWPRRCSCARWPGMLSGVPASIEPRPGEAGCCVTAFAAAALRRPATLTLLALGGGHGRGGGAVAGSWPVLRQPRRRPVGVGVAITVIAPVWTWCSASPGSRRAGSRRRSGRAVRLDRCGTGRRALRSCRGPRRRSGHWPRHALVLPGAGAGAMVWWLLFRPAASACACVHGR